MFPTIMIVDDEPSIVQSLKGLLTDEGFEVLTAANGYEALQLLETEAPDMVLLDIWMPGIDGIETLKEIKKGSPHTQVVMITGHGTIETAVQATKLGAFDFIEKPLSIDKVIVAINNALNFRRLEEENQYLRRKTIAKHAITGNSGPVQQLREAILRVAPTESWVLIKGENGTGKELVARNIHHMSRRAGRPFIDVNCAAIPEELIESELFGHEKGAFTGASGKKVGKFQMADKGSLFLDEIGDMSLKTQAKILRVLQEKQFQRVGGGRTLYVDVRVIAATNKNLEEEIEKGTFREDLYYRLNVVPIEVPSLRNRAEDLAMLVDVFFEEAAQKNRAPQKSMAPDAVALLLNYGWPGNVRELKNLIERLAIMVSDTVITADHLPKPYNPKTAVAGTQAVDTFFNHQELKAAKEHFEHHFIQRKLMENDYNITHTAKAIGVERSYLHRRIKKLAKNK
ncbi:sigma-54-dependent transcriptional regulator [Desulfatitalea alkaliphila]|uniref:Sigma-54 dependent transcriptional regulator n=1 Tax=Desulfatitalea alkaliphila TaxID=2929485 RepID=A0AA41R2N9_9BACT|nr:sigma-54 dependent transcriptional regulator [Desulfatitalea alkaliphila]MCJ8500947.1 sigma-54 dependent transcriptional regulator [Desulfatitalea alkaliphila]